MANTPGSGDLYVIDNLCIVCGVCVKLCPTRPRAIDWHDHSERSAPPFYKYDLCTHCDLCMEICPEKAIRKKN